MNHLSFISFVSAWEEKRELEHWRKRDTREQDIGDDDQMDVWDIWYELQCLRKFG
eukprot:c43931_g1_i1 orf=3-164(-)